MQKTTYIVVENEINSEHKPILTCFHGIFDNFEAANNALHMVAEISMERATYDPKNRSKINRIT